MQKSLATAIGVNISVRADVLRALTVGALC